MESRDDELDEWIIREGLREERRSRIVPASAERLEAEQPADGELAMESVAGWLGTEPEAPTVEFVSLEPRTISVTFTEDTVLPKPWTSPHGDNVQPSDLWGLTHQYATTLPQAEAPGFQVAGLTGVGNLNHGGRLLLNTSRWELLSIVGTPKWSYETMLSQVMNHAAEPWSRDHEFWLVGFGDVAEKLVSYCAHVHPAPRFHIVDSLDEISAVELKDTAATIYRLGSEDGDLEKFRALHVQGVGMVADRILSDQHMFITERDEGAAVLGPLETALELWTNRAPERIAAMEHVWETNQQVAAQEAAAADFDAFAQTLHQDQQQGAESLGSENVSREIDVDFEQALTTNSLAHGDTAKSSETERREDVEADEEESSEKRAEELSQAVAQAASVPDGQSVPGPEDAAGEGEQENSEAGNAIDTVEAHDESFTCDESTASNSAHAEAQDAGEETPDGVQSPSIRLHLLGAARGVTDSSEITGREAAVLIMLTYSEEPLSSHGVSDSLWPGEETGGHTARTRRSRLLKKLRSLAGDIISTDDQGWHLDRAEVTSDIDEVLDILANGSLEQDEALIAACEQIAYPLQGAEKWAEPCREQLIEKLRGALNELKDRAIDDDAFDIAKAAKAAGKKLEEG